MNDSKNKDVEGAEEGGSAFRRYCRIFSYADRIGWWMSAASFACMVGAGVLLPLMNLLSGQFVTVFNDFVGGKSSPDVFRVGINE